MSFPNCVRGSHAYNIGAPLWLIITFTKSPCYLFQMEEVRKSHIRGIVNAFKVPTCSITRTMKAAEEQESKCRSLVPSGAQFPIEVFSY